MGRLRSGWAFSLSFIIIFIYSGNLVAQAGPFHYETKMGLAYLSTQQVGFCLENKGLLALNEEKTWWVGPEINLQQYSIGSVLDFFLSASRYLRVGDSGQYQLFINVASGLSQAFLPGFSKANLALATEAGLTKVLEPSVSMIVSLRFGWLNQNHLLMARVGFKFF